MFDVTSLTEQVQNVLGYSQHVPNGIFNHVKPLIEQWNRNKQRFINCFGNQLIWEGPSISISYTPEMKNAMFEQFLTKALDYLSDIGCREDDWDCWIRDNEEGFFENKVVNPLFDSEMKCGMKLIKSFKFFDFPNEVIRHLQDLASQVIQKDKIEGILCLSVHPLDYLSISDNCSNWRSCHALDGEFRAGNLSYMLDSTTIVAYIKSKIPAQLENFPDGLLWNNKKWRVLLHIHPLNNIMYVNRQYPFSSDEIMDELLYCDPIRNMGFRMRNYYRVSGFRDVNDTTLNQNYFMIRGYIADPFEVCGGDVYSLQYNDFISSPHYTPQYVLNKSDNLIFNSEGIKRDYSVSIGVRVPCPCCGKTRLFDSNTFFCEECQEQMDNIIGICEECGQEITGEQDYAYSKDGQIYCENCMHVLQEQDEDEVE